MTSPAHSATATGARTLDRSRFLSSMPPLIRLAFLVMTVLSLLAFLAPLIAPHGLTRQDLRSRLAPPLSFVRGEAHLLGADNLGRDVFSRLLFGLRTTLAIAGLGVVIGALTGTLAGLAGGSLGGRWDSGLMLLADAQASIPLTLLALTAVALMGTSPLVLILIVGIADFNKYARLVRGQVLIFKELTFVEAARALGASRPRIVFRHILPNIVSPLIVVATINFSTIVILESALSFLGVGVQPPHTSLGQMLGEARNYLITTWWLAAIPGLAIVLITMSVSLIGDWLRDFFDPNLEPAGIGRSGPRPRP